MKLYEVMQILNDKPIALFDLNEKPLMCNYKKDLTYKLLSLYGKYEVVAYGSMRSVYQIKIKIRK